MFLHENAIESVVCEMAAILSRETWVKVQMRHNFPEDFFQMTFFY